MPLNSIYSVNLWIKHNSCLIWRCSLVCWDTALPSWVTESKGRLPWAVRKGRVCTCVLVAHSLVNGVFSGALCCFYLQTKKSQRVTEELQFLYLLCGIIAGQMNCRNQDASWFCVVRRWDREVSSFGLNCEYLDGRISDLSACLGSALVHSRRSQNLCCMSLSLRPI